MAEELEIETPQEDIFAQFGGKKTSTPPTDIFSEFGGKSVKKKADGSDLSNGTQSTSQSESSLQSVLRQAQNIQTRNELRNRVLNKDQFRKIEYTPTVKPTIPTNLPKSEEQEYNHKLNVREGALNTLKENYAKTGQKLDENSPNVQKYLQQIDDLEKNKDVALTYGTHDNKPYITRGEGFGESAVNALVSSFKAPVEAYDVNTIRNPKELADYFDAKFAQQPNVPESAPSGGIGGELGSMTGGIVKPMALLSLNAVTPGLGVGAMTAEAYFTSLAHQKEQLYYRGLQEGLPREQAAQKAMDAAGLAAVPDAAMAFALSGELPGISGAKSVMNKAADQSFRNAFVNATKSVGKIAGLGGIAEGAKTGAEAAAGYNVTPQEAIEKAWEGATEWGKMDLAFKIAGGIMSAPKYLTSAAKEYLTTLPKEQVDQHLSEMGEKGQQIAQSLQSYQNARQKVEGLVPDEYLSNYAGLIEKQDKIRQSIQDLEARKLLVPEPLHGKLDAEIADQTKQSEAIDKQLKKMAKSANPASEEVDDLTGEKVNRGTVSVGNNKGEPEQISKPIELSTEITTPTETKSTTVEEVNPVEQKTVKNNFPLPEKPVEDMTSAELNEYAKKIKKYDKDLSLELFGAEGRTKEKEDALTPEQAAEYGGRNLPKDGVYDPIEIQRMANRIEGVEESETAAEIADWIRVPLTQFARRGAKEDLGVIKAAARRAEELGIDPAEMIKAAVKRVANEFKDASDAEFVVSKVLGAITPKEAIPEQKQISEPIKPTENGKEANNAQTGRQENVLTETQTEGTGGNPPTEPPVTETAPEENTTSIKNEVTKNEREQKGLGEIEVEARRTFGDVFDKGKKMVDEGKIDPKILAKEVAEKPRALSPEENVALLYDRMRLRNEYNKVVSDIEKNKDNEVVREILKHRLTELEEAQRINDEAARKTGYEQGLGLATRKMMIKEDYSMLNQVAKFKAANDGKELPQETRDFIEKKTKELQEAQLKIEEYEKKIKELEASKKVSAAEKGAKKTNKSSEDFKKEREDIFKSIKDKWDSASKGKHGLTAVPVPYAAQLAAIAPEVIKLVKSYAEQGVTKLEEIVDDLHKNISASIPEITKKDVVDILAGEYTEKKSKKEPDREQMRLQANVNKIKNQIDLEKEKIRLGNLSKWDRGINKFQQWRRFALLSGIKVLGKIGVAAAARSGITTPLESLVGEGIRRIPGISKIAKGAPREGAGFNAKAEARALTQWFDKATYKDAFEVLKTGKGELDYLHDKKLHPSNGWLDWAGQLHAAIKTLPKRSEYFRAFEIRAEHAAKNGKDLSDPLVQQDIAMGAYADASRSIFMQDNYVTDAYKNMLRSLENSKISGAKSAAEIFKFMFPIIKVPSNYVAEETSYIFGGLKAAYALRKGIKDLTPDQKDFIIRALKKQSIGAVFLALGYFNPQSFGGYYDGRRKQDDLQAGDIKLFGVELPHWMSHTPLLEALQFGATIRRARDENKRKGKSKDNNILTGTTRGLGGILSQTPFYSTGSQLGTAFRSTDAAKNYLFRTGQSVIEPQLIKEIAQWTDVDEKGEPVKRKNETFMDYLQSGIPVLRQKLPKDNKKKH